MQKTLKRALAMILCLALLATMSCITAFAAVDFTDSSDGYYEVISKKDYVVSPGVSESEIILDNAAKDRRQALHVMEADPKNENVLIRPSYSNMENPNDSSKWKVITTSKHAEQIEAQGYNVVGAMNTALSWDTNEPLGKLVIDGVVWRGDSDSVGCQTYLAIKADGTADLRSSSEPLEADDYQTIGLNFSWMVKDGVNVAGSESHTAGDPRSVIGIKADGTVVMMMCDGRMSPYAAGLTPYEIGEVMLSLGCVDACNGDGGGSSSYLTKREGEDKLTKRSRNSDGIERETSIAITVINTAPDSDAFDHASLSPEHEYVTPGSDVVIKALGVSSAGTSADIPADVDWQLADPSFGTVTNGVFTSNGTQGDAVVQMTYQGNVVGETTIHVVVPDSIAFVQSDMTVPFGKTAELAMTANYGNAEVAMKGGDVSFEFSAPAVGTINGFLFTAASEETATDTSSNITATLAFDPTVTALATVTLGKGSEVIFDFEGENALDGWHYYDYNVTLPKQNKLNDSLIAIADANTGKVRNGDHSLAVTVDNSNAEQAGWIQYRLFYEGEHFEREGAIKIGFWAWVPEEAVADEIDVKIACMNADKANVSVGAKEVNSPDFAVNEQEEAGWHYFTLSIPHPYIYFGYKDTLQTTLLFQFYNYKQQWQNDSEMTIKNDQGKFTYFIDDITLEYSTAADDTASPTFSDFKYAPASGDAITLNKGAELNSSVLSFSTQVIKDTSAPTAVALDTTSLKAYIDGNEVPTVFANSILSTDVLSLNDGTHTVKFYAEDLNGNPASTVRTFTVNAGSDIPTVTLQPHDPDKTDLPLGSLYYLDIVASDISKVDSVTMDIDLNNSSTWELDHMIAASGFSADYEVNPYDNVASITITRNGVNGRSGVLASLPVRVFESAKETVVERKRVWVTATTKGTLLTTTDGEEIPCGSSKIETATEMSLGRYDGTGNASYTPHVHNATPVDDLAATCVEPGYTGRTYCAECDSIVNWGTEVPATGHSYDFVEGVLKCTACDDLYNGVYDVDGKYYVDGLVIADGWQTIDDNQYYFADGVAVTGQKVIDNHLYTFSDDGIYQSDAEYTGHYFDEAVGKWRFFDRNDPMKGFIFYEDQWYFFMNDYYAATGTQVLSGRNYKFEGDKGLCIGAWVQEAEGKKFYFCVHYYKNTWAEIEGETYYFDNSGYCYTGTVAIAHRGVYLGAYEFDEDGKFIGNITGVFKDARSGAYYYAEDGVLFNGGLLKWENNYYFARSNHLLATAEWFVSTEKANGLKPAGTYVFGADAKMVLENGIEQSADGTYKYYIDGIQQFGLGLIKVGDDYYYVRSNGTLAVTDWFVGDNDLGIPAGTYQFGADGKMVVLNGIQYVGGAWKYYINGVQQYHLGLIKVGDDYYYVRSNGNLATTDWFVGDNDLGIPAGTYQFGEDGKMVVLNGIQYVGGSWKYYVNGVQQYHLGLIKVGDDYYYVRSNGNLATTDWFVGDNDLGIPAGTYQFGEDGKMVLLNGIQYVGGAWKYYVNNEQQYGLGIIEVDGDYYYVRSNGNLATTDWFVGTNDLGVAVGVHHFGEDGKMAD